MTRERPMTPAELAESLEGRHVGRGDVDSVVVEESEEGEDDE